MATSQVSCNALALREQLLRQREELARQNEALLRAQREQLLAENEALKREQLAAQNAAIQRSMVQLLQVDTRPKVRRTSKGRGKWQQVKMPSTLVSIAEGDEVDDDLVSSPSVSTLTSTSAGSQITSSDEETEMPQETRTTLMLRHLPSTLSTQDLVSVLDAKGFAHKFDFVYVPADFATGTSFGYGIVNLKNAADADVVRTAFQGVFNWGTVTLQPCQVTWNAARQGLDALTRRYWDVEGMRPSSRPFLRRD